MSVEEHMKAASDAVETTRKRQATYSAEQSHRVPVEQRYHLTLMPSPSVCDKSSHDAPATIVAEWDRHGHCACCYDTRVECYRMGDWHAILCDTHRPRYVAKVIGAAESPTTGTPDPTSANGAAAPSSTCTHETRWRDLRDGEGYCSNCDAKLPPLAAPASPPPPARPSELDDAPSWVGIATPDYYFKQSKLFAVYALSLEARLAALEGERDAFTRERDMVLVELRAAEIHYQGPIPIRARVVVDALKSLRSQLAAESEQLERERVQHAACLVAAEGGGSDLKRDAWGWSPAFQAVRNLRDLYTESQQRLTAAESARDSALSHVSENALLIREREELKAKLAGLKRLADGLEVERDALRVELAECAEDFAESLSQSRIDLAATQMGLEASTQREAELRGALGELRRETLTHEEAAGSVREGMRVMRKAGGKLDERAIEGHADAIVRGDIESKGLAAVVKDMENALAKVDELEDELAALRRINAAPSPLDRTDAVSRKAALRAMKCWASRDSLPPPHLHNTVEVCLDGAVRAQAYDDSAVPPAEAKERE